MDAPHRHEDITFQLIDECYNDFKEKDFENFALRTDFKECVRSYAIVAILGPVSSGKSTLLNHLFNTRFQTMDDSKRGSQATLGIWMSRCPDVRPFTLVMDVEGSDCGQIRGNTSFEKQSALFTLLVADIVLINMWCKDIGREHAANKPLLRTIFQQAMKEFMKKPRKITLMFVVRDEIESRKSSLEEILREDLMEIWASAIPSSSTNLQLQDYFEVKFIFLPNYEEREEGFKLKVTELKEKFIIPALKHIDDKAKHRASMFPALAQEIWSDILGNKDLDVPKYEILVSIARCEKIKNDHFNSFKKNKLLRTLRKVAYYRPVPNFGEEVDSFLNTCVSKYDEEASFYDESVVKEKREQLIQECLQHVEHIYIGMVKDWRLTSLKGFMDAIDKCTDGNNRVIIVEDHTRCWLNKFDEGCEAFRAREAKWDSWKERAKLEMQMKNYASAKQEDRPGFVVKELYEPTIKKELSSWLSFTVCDDPRVPRWSRIREEFKSLVEKALPQLDTALSYFGMNDEDRKKLTDGLGEYAKNVAITKFREESDRAKSHLINKLSKHLEYDDDSSPQNPETALPTLVSRCVQLLAVLAVARWEEGDEDDDGVLTTLKAAVDGQKIALEDLDSNAWEKVRPSATLITPIKCSQLIKELREEMEKISARMMERFQASKTNAERKVTRLMAYHHQTAPLEVQPSKTLITHITSTEMMKGVMVEARKNANCAIEGMNSRTQIFIKNNPFLTGAVLALLIAVWGVIYSRSTHHMLE
ncbi:unnamed protein product [Cuscuta europaea]|uniref:GB1/RHD3-type G domain-containing protein n=1 Tax=Cuscuta europaea TaxID=41803 RepID=A0A9P0Z3W2_CUSEU|nr:unnamed protein product [Cuscuta europaea]